MVRKHREQAEQNKFSDNDKNWSGISAIIVDPNPRNNWVYVIEFPDGSQGLLRRLGRIELKRTQRVWVKLTDRPGFMIRWESMTGAGRGLTEPMCVETKRGFDFRALVSNLL